MAASKASPTQNIEKIPSETVTNISIGARYSLCYPVSNSLPALSVTIAVRYIILLICCKGASTELQDISTLRATDQLIEQVSHDIITKALSPYLISYVFDVILIKCYSSDDFAGCNLCLLYISLLIWNNTTS